MRARGCVCFVNTFIVSLFVYDYMLLCRYFHKQCTFSWFLGVIFFTEKDYCNPDPCVHGICVGQLNDFICFCGALDGSPNGYSGKTCEKSRCFYHHICLLLRVT